MNYENLRKVAILLMLVGAKESSKILSCLNDLEIQNIIIMMLNINILSSEEVNNILNEFYIECNNSLSLNLLSNTDYIYELSNFLLKKNDNIKIDRVFYNEKFLYQLYQLNNIVSNRLFYLIKNEHPYIIISVLFFLDRKHSFKIISHFSIDQQSEIIYLMSVFSGIKKSRLSALIKILDILLLEYNSVFLKDQNITVISEILCAMSIKNSYKIIVYIYKLNQNIAIKIISSIFVFENILQLDKISISILMKEIGEKKIVLSLYQSSEDIQLKFFQDLSLLKKKFLLLKNKYSDVLLKNMVIHTRLELIDKIKFLLYKKKISLIIPN